MVCFRTPHARKAASRAQQSVPLCVGTGHRFVGLARLRPSSPTQHSLKEPDLVLSVASTGLVAYFTPRSKTSYVSTGEPQPTADFPLDLPPWLETEHASGLPCAWFASGVQSTPTTRTVCR